MICGDEGCGDYAEGIKEHLDSAKSLLKAEEVLYAFCRWITEKKGEAVISSKDNFKKDLQKIEEFCKMNNL